jgi:hypothetical protein
LEGGAEEVKCAMPHPACRATGHIERYEVTEMTQATHRQLRRLRACLAVMALTLVFAAAPRPASAQAQTLFSNNNPDAVQNQPAQEAVVMFSSPVMIAKITTYHWNDGRGTPAIGTISLRSQTGQIYGPWQAEGEPGQGGVPNAYWVAYPNVSLPAGAFTVIDSDPATWAQNAASGHVGMVWAEGYRQ